MVEMFIFMMLWRFRPNKMQLSSFVAEKCFILYSSCFYILGIVANLYNYLLHSTI